MGEVDHLAPGPARRRKLCVVENLGDHPEQSVSGGDRRLDVASVGIVEVGLEQEAVEGDDGVEGRAQLVRNVGEKDAVERRHRFRLLLRGGKELVRAVHTPCRLDGVREELLLLERLYLQELVQNEKVGVEHHHGVSDFCSHVRQRVADVRLHVTDEANLERDPDEREGAPRHERDEREKVQAPAVPEACELLAPKLVRTV
mmetsp:Transcript_10636/g.34976  ORF Transcript_10636/g.34976 Transcript_10636/m.34976 type:complete len:201 (+) Transcript_10636:1670-2272(+)